MKVDYNRLAQAYAQHRRIHPGVLEGLIGKGNLDATSRVLEVGCGTGNYAKALQEAVGCSCWGVDPSQQMLAVATARNLQAGFVVGRAERLPYRNGCFDLVFSVDVVHHINGRAAYFHEAHRVLQRGGQVCTVTDSEETIRRRQPLSVYFPETVEYELQRYPPISDLRAMMVEAGFGNLVESTVELNYSVTDSQAFRDKVFSSLHLIPADAFRRGLQRMEQALRTGPIVGLARYDLIWGMK